MMLATTIRALVAQQAMERRSHGPDDKRSHPDQEAAREGLVHTSTLHGRAKSSQNVWVYIVTLIPKGDRHLISLSGW